MSMENDFYEIMECRLGYHDYATRTKITWKLQLLLDYSEQMKLIAILNCNQLNNRVLQLQVNF